MEYGSKKKECQTIQMKVENSAQKNFEPNTQEANFYWNGENVAKLLFHISCIPKSHLNIHKSKMSILLYIRIAVSIVD